MFLSAATALPVSPSSSSSIPTATSSRSTARRSHAPSHPSRTRVASDANVDSVEKPASFGLNLPGFLLGGLRQGSAQLYAWASPEVEQRVGNQCRRPRTRTLNFSSGPGVGATFMRI